MLDIIPNELIYEINSYLSIKDSYFFHIISKETKNIINNYLKYINFKDGFSKLNSILDVVDDNDLEIIKAKSVKFIGFHYLYYEYAKRFTNKIKYSFYYLFQLF